MSAPVEAPLAHALLTYRTTHELVDAAAPFLAAGVERGERVLAVLDRPKARAVAEALEERAAAVGFLEPEAWYRSPGLAVDGLHRQLGDLAGPPMRTIGELRWTGGAWPSGASGAATRRCSTWPSPAPAPGWCARTTSRSPPTTRWPPPSPPIRARSAPAACGRTRPTGTRPR